MYKLLTVEDKVRVDPMKFNLGLKEAIKSSLQDTWEGVTDERLGVALAVVSVGDVGEGKIITGDGAIHYPVTFDLLTYKPENHEVVKGEVIDVTEFGVFVRIGPIDGMIHVSQIMDDFVSYDPKNNTFTGKETNRNIREGDVVRARIISVSMEREYKIGLTTRQAGLGVFRWLEEEKKKKKSGGKKAKKSGKKKSKKIQKEIQEKVR